MQQNHVEEAIDLTAFVKKHPDFPDACGKLNVKLLPGDADLFLSASGKTVALVYNSTLQPQVFEASFLEVSYGVFDWKV